MSLLDSGAVHPEWQPLIEKSLSKLNQDYLSQLNHDDQWLPGREHLFAAFSLPLTDTKYILLGESPYPRETSANGYAFWDDAVHELWSTKGMTTGVNRATSLRNWLKALLHGAGLLTNDFSQSAIASIDKTPLVKTCEDFFQGMMGRGVLLLNASLVYEQGKVNYHAKQWRPFVFHLFEEINRIKPDVQLILFGKIAEVFTKSPLSAALIAEHPYNLSFIDNKDVLNFFKPMELIYDQKN